MPTPTEKSRQRFRRFFSENSFFGGHGAKAIDGFTEHEKMYLEGRKKMEEKMKIQKLLDAKDINDIIFKNEDDIQDLGGDPEMSNPREYLKTRHAEMGISFASKLVNFAHDELILLDDDKRDKIPADLIENIKTLSTALDKIYYTIPVKIVAGNVTRSEYIRNRYNFENVVDLLLLARRRLLDTRVVTELSKVIAWLDAAIACVQMWTHN